MCRWMGWSYDELLSAPSHLVARIAYHLTEQSKNAAPASEERELS